MQPIVPLRFDEITSVQLKLLLRGTSSFCVYYYNFENVSKYSEVIESFQVKTVIKLSVEIL